MASAPRAVYRRCPVPGCHATLFETHFSSHLKDCRASSVAESMDEDPGDCSEEDGSGDGADDDVVGGGGATNSGDGGSTHGPVEDLMQDPGLLPDAERRKCLLRWWHADPRFDPRIRFGPFNWSQMETVIEARMSEGMAARHFKRLHASGCGSLGLTLWTRDDVSRALRSLLDENPANSVAACDAGDGADLATVGSLHFFEETIQVWNGKMGEESGMMGMKLVMRELTPVVLAMYLDPHAYGRQRTRFHEPSSDGERVFSDPLTSNWFKRAEASAKNKQIVSFDGFFDETVIQSNGKRYKPCIAKSQTLPRHHPISRS